MLLYSLNVTFMIPLLCQAICSMVSPSTDTWSNSNFDIPHTTGLLQNKENPSENSIKNCLSKTTFTLWLKDKVFLCLSFFSRFWKYFRIRIKSCDRPGQTTCYFKTKLIQYDVTSSKIRFSTKLLQLTKQEFQFLLLTLKIWGMSSPDLKNRNLTLWH